MIKKLSIINCQLSIPGLIACLLTLLCSCEQAGDDYRYPSIVTDYTCLITNGKGQIEYMRLDNGCSYPVNFTDDYIEANGQEPKYQADTLYRAVSVYELATVSGDTVAHIYSIGNIRCSIPTPLPLGEKLYQDPVYLQSIWMSGGYLNFVIEVKALNGKHNVGYIDTTPKDMHGKEITFYHHVVSDVEAYRQKFYGSIPLDASLQQGDTLRFVVNTYDEGMKKINFPL